ncbi:MAG: GTPase HflX, partial [Clostridiales bacterium]|nr:GTPase HflX [Clostridiales bacterium]
IRHILKEAQNDRDIQRGLRKKSEIPLVALVGYTNSGKSTLLNKILNKFDSDGSEVFVKDMLFATLDTSVRKISLDKNRVFLLSDTVGFVSKLPHSLIEAFKATLEEVVEADLLIHVVDSSNEDFDNQIKITKNVLNEIGAEDKKSIYVFNKVDLLDKEIDAYFQYIPVSAKMGIGIDKLIEEISNIVFTNLKRVKFMVPYSEGSVLSDIMNKCETIEMNHKNEGTEIIVIADAIIRNKYYKYIV